MPAEPERDGTVDLTLFERAAAVGLRVSRPRPGVTLLTIDRQERYNALDEPLLLELPGLLDAIAEDDATRALVVCGAGSAFCAGGDLNGIRKASGRSAGSVEQFLLRTLVAARSIYGLPQPTVAAVNGPVAGGGLGLALACDVVIAAPAATFSASFIHMGLVPDMGLSWLLPRLIGSGAALEFLLAGRQVEAAEAQALGLVSRIADDAVESAVALAATFAAMPATAVTTTKAMVRAALEVDLSTAIAAEAHEQDRALHGPEFADRYGLWRRSVTGVRS